MRKLRIHIFGFLLFYPAFTIVDISSALSLPQCPRRQRPKLRTVDFQRDGNDPTIIFTYAPNDVLRSL